MAKTMIIIGAPGAGKGTQSDVLVSELGVVHISSGDLLRENRRLGTELGVSAAEYMSKGQLVPDDLVISMIMERMSRPDVEKGVLLDGFPRTLAQAAALDEALAAQENRVSEVLYIKVDPDGLIERLSGRWSCPACGQVYNEKAAPPAVPGVCDGCGGHLVQRDDDRPEKIRTRLHEYFELTMPIVDYYRARGVLYEVNGDQPIDTVSREVLRCVAGHPAVSTPIS